MVQSASTLQKLIYVKFLPLLLFSVGQPAGSLQAVKESLLRMRWQRSAASSTSLTANASTSVRNLLPPIRPQEDTGGSSVVHVADELIRYVLDDEDLTVSPLAVDRKTTASADDVAMSSDPRDVASALQHQQLRAEVTDWLMLFFGFITSDNSGRASQRSWSHRTILNKHGRRRYCDVDFNKMTSLDRPAACGHVCWGRSASHSTASNASAVLIGQ